ncbi:hypothetical protein SynSYN20_00804 [Synechococcus sp. SYN20]|nr:hypothetical protein SynSYN20_00804 [Synechococcus sp. SYN20]
MEQSANYAAAWANENDSQSGNDSALLVGKSKEHMSQQFSTV